LHTAVPKIRLGRKDGEDQQEGLSGGSKKKVTKETSGCKGSF